MDGGVVDDAAVAVRGGAVVAVGPRSEIESSFTAQRVIDAAGQVVAPGFVDAHVHLGAFLDTGRGYQISTGPGPFSGGGRIEVILPMIARMCSMSVPDELVAAVVRPGLAAMLKAGITGVVDAGGPGVDGVAAATAELGIRAAVGPSLVDMWHDEHGRLTRHADPDRLLDRARELAARHDGSGAGRVRACSDELLAGIAELTADRGLPTHMHSHISDAAVAAHDAAFGRTATERLFEAGLLGSRTTLMHAGSLTDDDVSAFAEAGVTVNHNPGGNALFGFGSQAGARCPGCSRRRSRWSWAATRPPRFAVSTPFDMVHAALMTHREAAGRDDALTLEQALTMATCSGPSLGRPGVLGRVAEGALADLVLVDATGLHHLGTDHPVPALALHAHPDDVTTVIVDGQVVVEQGQLTQVNEAEIAETARQTLRHIAAQD